MATYSELVRRLAVFQWKQPFDTLSPEQLELLLTFVNDAFRYVYNNGDLSFKTVIKRGFVYTVQTDLTKPARGTPLPDNFMGFHQTGEVYLEDAPNSLPLIYLPYHKIIRRTEGPLSQGVGLPTHYGLGGPSDGVPVTNLNQREILLWKTPSTPTINLKLVYQMVPPPDIAAFADADVEIPRVPAAWHLPVILPMAKMFAKMDQGGDESTLAKTLATAVKQMNIQEPHGREKPARRPRSPFWNR